MKERLDSRVFYRTLEKRAAARATFIDWVDEGYSYQSLLGDVRKYCALFDSRGLEPGARVLIRTGDEKIAVGVFVAALLDGHVPIMLTPELPSSRTKAIAELTKPALMVVDQLSLAGQDWIPPERVLPVLPASQRPNGILDRIWRSRPATKSLGDRLRTLSDRQPRCDSKLDDLAYVLFTSGTTSAPKGVMITHRNIFAHLDTLSRVFGYNNTSAIFNGMPLAHADGLVQGPLLALANGCRLIRPSAFLTQALEQHLNMVRAKRATHFIAAPTVYGFIDRYAQHDDYFEAGEFIAFISVAAKLEDQLWRRLEDRFARPVYNMYGLTETVTSALYAGPGCDLGTIGTIGKPIDIDICLVNPDGSPPNEGEVGEIWLRGENVSPGYFGDTAATAEKYEGDWLKTGDLAIRRVDGAYEIRGRINTTINCGGLLINPGELDEVLMSHQAVVEAASVGLPDSDFGEIAVSAVVLDTAASEFELTKYCSRFLEPRKVPKRVFIVPSIPRGDATKPQVEALRALLAARIQQDGFGPSSPDLTDVILTIASRTFRIPVDFLSLDSSPQTVAEWDSFAHVSLILGVEKQLQRRIATADALAITSLRRLLDVVSRT